MKDMYLGIDIGGTWIKGTAVLKSDYNKFRKKGPARFINQLITKMEKVPSPLRKEAAVEDLILSIRELIGRLCTGHHKIKGIGISTAGIVNYHGTGIINAAEHLALLRRADWKEELEGYYSCDVILVNDADACAIGMAELGYLAGDKTVGVMVVGTGLGFTVWRNGRRWRPGGILTLLGGIRTSDGTYDKIASALNLTANVESGDLTEIFTDPKHRELLGSYNKELSKIIRTAAILYNIDELFLSGGLTGAAAAAKYNLHKGLDAPLESGIPELSKPVKLNIIDEGNRLQLLGAIALVVGEAYARRRTKIPPYGRIETEKPYDENLMLQEMSAGEIVKVLWDAEEESGKDLVNSLPAIAEVVETIAGSISKGGRLIYVGAGTSGRIAAMDAVEIPCTYGLPKDRIVAIVAGGIADAAIEMESNFEEDASSVPEMLLLNISDRDVVVGISASGSAYFVQSALAFAKFRGAYTVMVRQSSQTKQTLPFCHTVIPLCSGHEVVAGSTRMKAGTATKKVLNFLTTTAMIRLGKVNGPYMIDVAGINKKLEFRAASIRKKFR